MELELSIETLDKDSQQLVEKYDSIIKDSAIAVVGKMTPEDLNSLSGKLLLEKRLKKENPRNNQREVYLADFLSSVCCSVNTTAQILYIKALSYLRHLEENLNNYQAQLLTTCLLLTVFS